MATNDKLELRFDPHTIEHLGIKMYSQLPYALAELVANSYDAGAENVEINLYDKDDQNKRIIVSDDGEGMSFDEVNENFLVIGRRRREDDLSRNNKKGRKITGKKGIGKLALFGIGKTINITTSREGAPKATCFSLNWDDILNETSGRYNPSYSEIVKSDSSKKGTLIELTNLTRISGFDINSIAVSLSKLFNCFDNSFRVIIRKNNFEKVELTRDLKYESIDKEFEWDIKELCEIVEKDTKYKSLLNGKIISSKKPMKPDLRGITIYVNGRLANIPSFFGVSEAGHTFSYLTGWIDADYLDEYDKDLISTDRQSLSWDMPEAQELQCFLQKIIRYLVKDWSAKRKDAKEEMNTEKTGINISNWYATVPDDVRPKLTNIINKISDKPEIDDEDFSSVVHQVYDLIPPYTYFHYRLLHEQVKDASKVDYQNKNYYSAFQEALKRYKNAVKDKSGVNASEELDIMNKSFGKDKPLQTTAKFKLRPNGQPFSEQTLNNIEEGQLSLSRGIVQGGRNIVSHEEHDDLRKTGLFTEKDCLDLLSLLSHLYKRLDDSVKKED